MSESLNIIYKNEFVNFCSYFAKHASNNPVKNNNGRGYVDNCTQFLVKCISFS